MQFVANGLKHTKPLVSYFACVKRVNLNIFSASFVMIIPLQIPTWPVLMEFYQRYFVKATKPVYPALSKDGRCVEDTQLSL